MSVDKAKNNYMGLNGSKRMNCAQAIVSAFKDEYDVEDELVETFRQYGGGRAPEGMCGAYYAVKFLIEKNHNDNKIGELEKYFLEGAGALDCRNIKGMGKFSCLDCVEKCSEFLEKHT